MDEETLQRLILCTMMIWGLFSGKTMVSAQHESCWIPGDQWNISGDTNRFEKTGEGVRLMDSAAGESVLWADPKVGNTTIQLEGILGFSPSSSNAFGLVGITHLDTTGTPAGWILHLGSSGSEDKITFHRWEQGDKGPLLSEGVSVFGDQTAVTISWMVDVNSERIRLFSREKRGLRWRSEGEFDLGGDPLTPEKWGLWMKYTSTRKDRFWIHQWCSARIDPTSNLKVTHWESPEPGLARLFFSQEVSLGPEYDAYLLPQGLPPVGMDTDSMSYGLIKLEWDPDALSARNGPLIIEGIRNEKGEQMSRDTVPIAWDLHYRAGNRIMITEIMADPDPSRGWPPTEWVELYHMGPDSLIAKGWTIGDRTGEGEIESFYLAPEEMIVIVPRDWSGIWKSSGVKVVSAHPWPGFNNSSDDVRVSNENGDVKAEVSYELDRIEPASRRDGGWSFIRDPSPCLLDPVWSFSPEESGASPGKLSWPLSNCPEDVPTVDYDGKFFSICLPRISMPPSLDLELEIGPGTQINVRASAFEDVGQPGCWHLEMEERTEVPEVGYLRFPFAIRDTCGKEIWPENVSLPFGRPVAPDSLDLVISEILIKSTEAAPYLEFFNRSKHAVQLEGLILHFSERGNWVEIDNVGALFPGQYMAVTAYPCRVADHFRAPDTARIISLPALTDIPGSDPLTIELIRKIGFDWILLDRVYYDSDWHAGPYKGARDVSLYKRYPDQDGMKQENWSSSLPPGRGGTPGWGSDFGAPSGKVKENIHFFGTLGGSTPDRYWNLSWDLADHLDWELMVQLFTEEGEDLGFLRLPGPVSAKGDLVWHLSDIRERIPFPGLYLISVICWSSDGDHIRYTGHGLVLPD